MKSHEVYVHPNGMCESDQVGAGTRIWAFAHVMKGAIVGENTNIGECSFVESGAIIGSNCTIKNHVAVWHKVTCEDYVFLGPSAVLTNDLTPRCEFKKNPDEDYLPTLLKRGCTVGANAVIICGCTLGQYAMVGAGAVVTRDVPDFGLVLGNPATLRGYACKCGSPLWNGDLECSACGRVYKWSGEGISLDSLNDSGLQLISE